MKIIPNKLRKVKKQLGTYAVIALIALLLVFLLFDLVKALITICMFIFLNILVRFYKRILTGIPIEFEIVIFGGVLTTMAFGLWAGWIVVIFASVLGEFLNQSISPNYLVNVICYILVPIFALLLTPQTVVIGGITIMIIMNIIIFLVFLYTGYDIFRNAGYAITNIALNYLLFSYLAKPILSLLLLG